MFLILTFVFLGLGAWAAIEAKHLARSDIELSQLVEMRNSLIVLREERSTVERNLTNIRRNIRALDVHFSDIGISTNNDAVIVVGTKGSIWITRKIDGTWAPGSSETNSDIRAATFDDSGENAIAVGENGTILRSADFGRTWVAQDIATRKDFNDVAFAQGVFENRAIVVGDDGIIAFSQDGGRSWKRSKFQTPHRIYAVAFFGGTEVAVAVGDNGTLIVSDNGGQTWTSRRGAPDREPADINAIATDGSATAVAVGDDGAILVSTDGGKNWTYGLSDDEQPDFYAVAIGAHGRNAFAVGRRGAIWKTTNGLANWKRFDNKTTDRLNAVSIYDGGQSAIAVGSDGTVLVTADGGATWQRRDSGLSSELTAVDIGEEGTVIIGEESTILYAENGIEKAQGNVEIKHVRSQEIAERQLSDLEQERNQAEGILSSLSDRIENFETILGSESIQGIAHSDDQLSKKGVSADEGSSSSWTFLLHTTSVRVAILLVVLFLCHHLIGLVRYNIRLSGFYLARRDAISLFEPEAAQWRSMGSKEFERLVYVLSPEKLEFGRSPRNVVEMAMQLVKSGTGGGKTGASPGG